MNYYQHNFFAYPFYVNNAYICRLVNHLSSKAPVVRCEYCIYASSFAEKMWVAFAKATHIFSQKYLWIDIVLTWTVDILITNKLLKLIMLWTTRPRSLQYQCIYQLDENPLIFTKVYVQKWKLSGQQIILLKADKNLPNSNPKPDLHNINACIYIKFGENPLIFTKVIIRKPKYRWTHDRRMDRHTDFQQDTIIPHYYWVAGYKN